MSISLGNRIELSPSGRRPCKSVVKRKQNSPDARYGGARKSQHPQKPQLATRASRRWFLLFAEPDIHLLSPAPWGPSQKIECVFAASPETIRREPREFDLLCSVGHLRDLAACALCNPVIPFLPPRPPTVVLRNSATSFPVTLGVSRFPHGFAWGSTAICRERSAR